jgi:hypothetical protein
MDSSNGDDCRQEPFLAALVVLKARWIAGVGGCGFRKIPSHCRGGGGNTAVSGRAYRRSWVTRAFSVAAEL